MNKESLKVTNLTTALSTLIDPAPFAAEKLVSVNGAENTISCGFVDIPAKNMWFLNTAIDSGSDGAPVALMSVTDEPSKIEALFTPSAYASFSVLLKLF